MKRTIRTKRVYDVASAKDGFRIFVDRLWPRGKTKLSLCMDVWAKSLAPSHNLRQWLHEDRSRLDDFEVRYRAELAEREPELDALLETIGKYDTVTLITASRQPHRGHVPVLKTWLETKLLTFTPRNG